MMRPDFRHWMRRVAWLLAIWAISVALLGVAAWGLRVIMQSIGMSPP